MLLKTSNNSDRYKEEVPMKDNNSNDDNQDEFDEYADEIIDLGDDIQPFSMQFKIEKKP